MLIVFTNYQNDSELVKAPVDIHSELICAVEELESGWEIDAAFTIGDVRTVWLTLCTETGETVAAVTLFGSLQYAKISMDILCDDTWKNLFDTDTIKLDTFRPVKLSLRHLENSPTVWLSLIQDGKELQSFKISDISTDTLLAIVKAGIGANRKTDFSEFTVCVPIRQATPVELILKELSPKDNGFYMAIAQTAVDDMLTHFWDGNITTGRIIPTSHGYAANTDYTCIWESAMLLYELYDMWILTGDEKYKTMLVAEATYVKSNYDFIKLQVAGDDQNWACDDCGRNAMLYLIFYNVTGDKEFLDLDCRAFG